MFTLRYEPYSPTCRQNDRSDRRRRDVITLHRLRYDAIMTSFACWVEKRCNLKMVELLSLKAYPLTLICISFHSHKMAFSSSSSLTS